MKWQIFAMAMKIVSFRFTRADAGIGVVLRRCIAAIALMFCIGLPAAHGQQPWYFAVLSDPQLGMYAADKNFNQEIANFKFALENLNRLHPRFVVICGDLINRTGDPSEIQEYKELLKTLDPSIPVYNVAGNHDVGNAPTKQTVSDFRRNIGLDYYTFVQNGLLGIVLDSNLIQSPESDPEDAKLQADWLTAELSAAKTKQMTQVVVFQHIPYFVHSPDEADAYFNIPRETRRNFLNILENAGVRYVFAGHTHKSGVPSDGKLTEIITGAVGKPLGGSFSGLRIVKVDGKTLDSTWYCFGGIPNTLGSEKQQPPTCTQQ